MLKRAEKRTLRRQSWSLHARLTVFHAGAVAVLLIACLAGLYLSLNAQMEEEDRNFLYDQSALIRALALTAPEQTFRFTERIRTDPKRNPSPALYVRMATASGRLIAETPGMGIQLPSAAFPRPTGPSLEIRHLETTDGEPFLVASQWIDEDARPDRRWLQVALDQSSDEKFGHILRRNVVMALLIGIVLSAAAGAWVARSALRPLGELASAATHVTAKQMQAELDTAGWPVELARLAEAFEGMLARLEESFERLSQFSANLSHELRTPIHNLRGEAEVALAQAKTPQEFRSVLESSLEEYDRFARLIDNLLFIARAESSEIQIEAQELELAREMIAVIEFHEALADEQGVTIAHQGAGRLRLDSVLFRRMLSNLLSNALRHTPTGGRIDMAAERHSDGQVEIRVSDTGSGIPAEHLARIYDRFYRVAPPHGAAAGNDGFGLGLAIVKSIMALHGGTISVESTVGVGTTVRLMFPASRAS